MITAKDSAVSARVWIARSPKLDFREAQWEMKSIALISSTIVQKGNLTQQFYQIDLEKASSANQAIFAKLEFAYLNQRFWLSTIPYVLESR